MKIEEIVEKYGVDPSLIPYSSYSINENTGILSITSKSKVDFSDAVPKDEIYGTFSDSYYYYFTPLKENKNEQL